MAKNKNTGMKTVSVILGALSGGFMWRCRGESGWGSSWGLYAVGLVMMLLIYHFYSDRKGMKFEMIPVGSFLLGLGVTGYATVIDQSGGVLWSDLPYGGELINNQTAVLTGARGDVYVPVNPVSGTVIIFIMAFTLVPLFTFFVTSLFSDKKYGIKDYAIIAAIFFISGYIFKMTVSHPILKLINPEQVEYAAKGLKYCNFDYSSPFSAYMSHFQNRKWTQDIPFFENYYMSIEHISDALAVITTALYILIARKDKYTAFGSMIIDFLTAVASTVCSPLISGHYHAGFFENITYPDWFVKISDWGVWEYCTGFFFGLSVMLFLAVTGERHTVRTGYDDTPLYTGKTANFIFSFITSLWVFCISPARIIGIRTAKLFETLGITGDDEPLGTILTVVLAIVSGIFLIKSLNINIFKKGSNAVDMLPVDFAKKFMPAYLIMCFFAYFILDDFSIININKDITVPLMLITFVLIALIYISVRKKSAIKR